MRLFPQVKITLRVVEVNQSKSDDGVYLNSYLYILLDVVRRCNVQIITMLLLNFCFINFRRFTYCSSFRR